MAHLGGIENVDALAPQDHQAVSFKPFQEARHHLARGSQFVRELLMGQVQCLAVTEQGPGQALIEPLSDDAEVKRAYRKLMSQHHPDKLVAKGLPPEMMNIAKEKTQKIAAAYDLIMRSRG